MADFAVIVPAAGSSSRFGGGANKLMQTLEGRPVLAWTLSRFASRADVRQIVVACNFGELVHQCAQFLDEPGRKKLKVCLGGTCRADSVRVGLLATSPEMEWVAVHDAARPLAGKELIDRTFAAAERYGAAAAALPAHLTIKQAAGPLPAKVRRTLPRQELWAMQTPQAMRRADLIDAYAKCPISLQEVTDDVQLLELAGMEVYLVEGEEKNLKITTALDLQIAQNLMES
jgi:2-C-methyl-D-erythritol 4-phosphate cytidylyltransferase